MVTMRTRSPRTLPRGTEASLDGIAESSTVLAVKQMIETHHGVRASHQVLSFIGCELEDSMCLLDYGIADGALLQLRLARSSAQGAVAAPSTSSAAVAATAGVPRCLIDEADSGAGSFGGPLRDDEASEPAEGDFLTEVQPQDPSMAPLLDRARAAARACQEGDCIGQVSKRSGYRLTLLAEKAKKPRNLFGYVVFRFRKATVMSIAQVVVDPAHRGRGIARRLLAWLSQHARRANAEVVLVASPSENVRFYEDLGFQRSKAATWEGEPLQPGQVSMEYRCRRGPKPKKAALQSTGGTAAGTASAPTAGAANAAAGPPRTLPSRAELVRKVFQFCDKDGDGYLNKEEMYTFGRNTGFDGSLEEWAGEYEALRDEHGSARGIDEACLLMLVNDDSDQGCYCTDEELAQMLPASALQAPSRPAAASPSPVAEAPSSRGEQVRRLFQLLDRDRDGFLNQQEMRSFANMSGFEGDEAAWAGEYEALLGEASSRRGIAMADLSKLVDDESENGCYCTDEELTTMLETLEASAPALAAAPAAPPAQEPRISAQPAQADEPDTGAGATGRREELVLEVFNACGGERTGRLLQKGMRLFATETGFDGDDAAWAQEYKAICDEAGVAPEAGIDLAMFTKLVNDDSDEGCYCTDEELEAMRDKLLEEAPPPSPSPSPSPPVVAPAPQAPVAPVSWEPEPAPRAAAPAAQSAGRAAFEADAGPATAAAAPPASV
eukprot:TRINITY_DN25010_c0_g1_i1.p1 TRINITY_DN25010_c0_g1~~TRINITY_DN25010_c0_g1_i1.p1  ORF type:complete len:723 (+),score=177.78 TRINITY_DN25010_c0_g1_i1:68-2236(+)